MGAYMCSSCHETEFADWSQHGHAWMQVHTGGQVPPADLFEPVGEELPVLPQGITWDMVQDIFGHFRDGEGYLLLTNGKRVVPPSASQKRNAGQVQQMPQHGF